MAEADAAVSQAMGQLERTTARRYLRLFRWYLTATCALCLVWLFPQIFINITFWLCLHQQAPFDAAELGVIGGADGPTAIITTTRTLGPWETFWEIGFPALLLIVCIVLAVKVHRLEKKLK